MLSRARARLQHEISWHVARVHGCAKNETHRAAMVERCDWFWAWGMRVHRGRDFDCESSCLVSCVTEAQYGSPTIDLAVVSVCVQTQRAESTVISQYVYEL